MRVGYIGGFWCTNIGNSFYNLGALHLLKDVLGDRNVYFIPDPPQEYWQSNLKNYDLISKLDLDLFVITGPSFNSAFRRVYQNIFSFLSQRKKKIAFLSVGASEYSPEEADDVASFLKDQDVLFTITRDEETYELYRNRIMCPVYNGLCTSMFLNDAVQVPRLDDEYYVMNFSLLHEPMISLNNSKCVIQKKRAFPFFQKQIDGIDVVRPDNSPFSRFGWIKYFRPMTYYSDLPQGYLTIFKNARGVFSDRVHTCAASLILGSKAMYFRTSKRASDGRNNLFSRLKANSIFSNLTALNFSYIESEKKKMKEFLCQVTRL